MELSHIGPTSSNSSTFHWEWFYPSAFLTWIIIKLQSRAVLSPVGSIFWYVRLWEVVEQSSVSDGWPISRTLILWFSGDTTTHPNQYLYLFCKAPTPFTMALGTGSGRDVVAGGWVMLLLLFVVTLRLVSLLWLRFNIMGLGLLAICHCNSFGLRSWSC